MDRTMRVDGCGKISVQPDAIRISGTFQNIMPTYERAIKSSARDVTSIKKILEILKIDASTLKTENFEIDKYTETTKNQDGSYTTKFAGYRYCQIIEFTFPRKDDILGKLIYQLGHCAICPTYNIYYEISDRSKIKSECIAKAVNDAREKAQIIADASNVKLGAIMDIKYGANDFDSYITYYMHNDRSNMNTIDDIDGSYDVDIEPKNINVSDRVNITFRIE